MDTTLAYYNTHAADYIKNTQALNMGHLHAALLIYLPENARILDLGCGSGRDAKAFQEYGLNVDVADPSLVMLEATQKFTGIDGHNCTAQELNAQEHYNAIWACASLLHVPPHEHPQVFKNLTDALKPNGHIYTSFKKEPRQDDQTTTTTTDEYKRHFTNLGILAAEKIIYITPLLYPGTPQLTIIRAWYTDDIGNNGTKWTNLILRKPHPTK